MYDMLSLLQLYSTVAPMEFGIAKNHHSGGSWRAFASSKNLSDLKSGCWQLDDGGWRVHGNATM